jgi:hypothetical protein
MEATACVMKLRMWYAVHGAIELSPSPAAMMDSLRPKIPELKLELMAPDGEWREDFLRLPKPVVPDILVRRARRGEDDFQLDRDGWVDELSAWGGPMPNLELVIAHLRKTQQSVFLTPISKKLGPAKMARACEQLCGYIARATDGLIHVYQEGFFSPEGESLHPYAPRHRLKTR